MYTISFIETIRLFDIIEKMNKNKISLNDGEIIMLRSIYHQMSENEKTFMMDKYGESMDFLENYEGVRKRKYQIKKGQ